MGGKMINEPVIGILGGSGLVGKEAVKTILSFTNYHILLGGRDLDKMKRLFFNKDNKVKFFAMDLFNDNELNLFCSKCDIVINCAGPAKKILDKIAIAAINHNIHYIDVSADAHLYKLIKKNENQIKEKKLLFIIGAGLYPGLSEVFPSYIAGKYFETTRKMEVFFASKGALSLNAAYDFVCSIEDNYSEGMAYIKNGNVEKVKNGFNKKIKIPCLENKLNVYPALTDDFKSVVVKNKIQEAYFYNTYENKSSLSKLIEIRILEKYRTEEEKLESAKVLADQSNFFGNDDFTTFYIVADGYLQNKNVKKKFLLYFEGDGNFVTGKIAGNTSILLLNKCYDDYGCHYLYNGIDIDMLMEYLSQQNIGCIVDPNPQSKVCNNRMTFA